MGSKREKYATLAMKNILLFPMLLFFFNSCSPVRVVATNEKDDVDFEAYDTYNFMDISLKNDSIDINSIPEVAILKEAIAAQMEGLGYEQAQNPDLWINIGLMVEEKVQTRETNIRDAPIYIGQRRYHWESEEVVVDEYEQGTVSIDIIDAHTNERIWEGIAAGTVTDDDAKMEKRINDAMELLFKRYPNNADI